jgi:hypothetical protein
MNPTEGYSRTSETLGYRYQSEKTVIIRSAAEVLFWRLAERKID